MSFSPRKLALVTGAVILGAVLASCASESSTKTHPTGKTSASSSTETTQSSTATPTKTPTSIPGPKLSAEKFTTDCSTLFSAEKLYEFNPNLGVIPSKNSIKSDVASTQQSLNGVFCDVVHLSTNETVQVGVVKLTKQSAADQSKTISRLGAAGAYQVSTSVTGNFAAPTGQFVEGQYWVSVSALTFTSGADASMWSNFVVQNLPR